jgi:hypothetical protein
MSTRPRASFPVSDQATLVSLARTISLMVRQEHRLLNGALQPPRTMLFSTEPSASGVPTIAAEAE